MKRFLVTEEDTALYFILVELLDKDIEPDLAIAALNWLDSWEERSWKEIPLQEALIAHANKQNW
jgi:hypothetical protein